VTSSESAEAIHRANVYEIVAERMLDDISEGRFAPGASLPPERELAQRFGVGRSSVREALRVLESHGVVRADRHAQFVVRNEAEMLIPAVAMLVTLGHATLRDVHELRRSLEIEIAGLAASRRTDSDLKLINLAMERMKDSLGSRSATMQADLAFHEAVAAASHNRALTAMSTAVCTTLSGTLRGSYHVSAEVMAQHGAVAEAIQKQDVELARRRIQEHMEWITSIIPLEDAGYEEAVR